MQMKKILKITALILAAALAAASLNACAGNGESATKTSDGAAETKQKLIMATNAYFPPYEFYDDSGNIIGIDAEIAELIADKLDMELVIEDMEFDSILSAITSGKADMGMAGMTVTEERLKSVDFSVSYATGKQVIIVKSDSQITSFDGLTDKTIGVQLMTTGDTYILEDIESGNLGNAKLSQYASGFEAIGDLVNGRIDAVVIDNEPAKVFVSKNEGIKILPTEYVVEDYAIAFAKGSSLTSKVNAALEELIADGSVKNVVDKYITA